MYYPCSENKDADQLRSYCEADLRLCFRICKLLFFSCTGSYMKELRSTCIYHKRLPFSALVGDIIWDDSLDITYSAISLPKS